MILSASARLALIQGLFLVSGFCGLIYESIWSHYLKLFLGHAAYAQSVVLVVFIGGMAAGAWLAGRFAERIRRPLIAYAIAEFLVGWAGVAFHPVFEAATGWAYASLLPTTCSADGWCVSSWALAALLILPQSVLLGSTFPLMTSGAIRLAPSQPGRLVAGLYFLNSLGAVGGVLASAFVLIPAIGLPGASLTAGTVNILLALTVYAVAGGVKSRPTPAHRSASDRAPETATSPRALLLVAALTGLSSFLYEIAWIRLLSLVLGSSTHAFELMLASFILGLALGGSWVRGRIDRLRDARSFLGVVQVLMGLAAMGSVVAYGLASEAMAWLIRALSPTDAGYAVFNAGSAAIAMAMMLPATFCAGMTLPLITAILLAGRIGERALGYVYAWNTAGSIIGVLLAVHVALPVIGVKDTLIAGAAIDIALGAWLLARRIRARRWSMATGVVAVGALAAVAAPATLDIDPRRALSGVYRTGQFALDPSFEIVFRVDGKTATVSVERGQDGLVILRTNGKPDASALTRDREKRVTQDEQTMVLSAAIPLAHNPEARHAAVIGFGSGFTTATLLDMPTIVTVDTIEIEPKMVEGASHFRPHVDRAFDDPRSRIVFDDAKSYFAKSGRRYDIVVSEPSNPWVAGVSSLFTEEFYRQVDAHLTADGVLAQWIQAYEFEPELLASIVRACAEVFADTALYNTHGGDLVLVASHRALPLSTAVFEAPALAARLASIGVVGPADLERRRVAGHASLSTLLSLPGTLANSDYFPIVDIGAPVARFKRASVTSLAMLVTAPVPVVDLLEKRKPPATMPPLGPPLVPGIAEIWARARRAHEFVVGPGFGGSEALPTGLPQARTLAEARVLLVDCVSPESSRYAFDSIIALASEFAAILPPSEMERFVWRIEDSPCRPRLPAATPQWTALLRAIGRRDAATIAEAAGKLLERDDLTILQREYAVLAALAGNLGAGRIGPAQRVIGANAKRVTPEFRSTTHYRFLRDIAFR